MNKVKNRKVIANISQKSLRANRSRNFVAIFAIALTALMFTALFTVGTSMMKTIENQTCRQVGTTSHGGYKFITQEQYDKIAANPMVKDISYNINVGTAENPELKKEYSEIRYSEDKDAKWGFSYPTTGKMPQKEMEVATTTAVLDALGIPHKLGVEVPLSYYVNGELKTDTFTLCGFWEKDPVSPANQIWLSKSYVEKVAPVNPVTIYERETDILNPYIGTISCSLWFSNSFGIDAKMDKLTKACGYEDNVNINSGVNWAYAASEVDIPSVLIVVVSLLLILLSGYLIIFNIFNISVAKDTRYYGLLKTIGTTGKQLKRIVRRQALVLSCIGIPIGLFFGYFVGVVLAPVILNSITNIQGNIIVDPNPLIFVGSALFALFTVWISCNRPARAAAKVSPMEALYFNEVALKKKVKNKSAKVSPFRMGFRNIFRSKKKTFVVILSLSLSIILLNSVYSITKSFDMDKYVAENSISDFTIADSALLTRFETVYLENNVVSDIQSIKDIGEISPVYAAENSHHLSLEGQKNMEVILEECQEYFYPNSEEDAKIAKEEGLVNAHIYGVDQMVFDKLNQNQGDFDWEAFQTENYVIASAFMDTGEYPYYNIGDMVTIAFDDGSQKEYQVMALGGVPYPAGMQHSHSFNPDFILPAEEYLKHAPEATPLKLEIDVDSSKEAQVDKAISSYCENTSLSYVSKATLVESLKGVQRMYVVVGGALSGILALIGLLNFINAMVTSIHSRRRELAMLQSVGMTTKQMREMLIWEGMTYVGLTAIFCLTLGLGCSVLLTYAIAGSVWFFSYHFTVLPILCAIPVMVALAYIIPLLSYKNACKESVVERLRETE